jgi:hypothetical protein
MRIEFRTINPNVKIVWGDKGDHTYAALETGGQNSGFGFIHIKQFPGHIVFDSLEEVREVAGALALALFERAERQGKWDKLTRKENDD